MSKLPTLSPHKLALIILASLSTLCLNATAQQVYESTDAQGNVTFSDTPTTGSRAVTIEAPNLSDAVKVPPSSPEAEPAPAPESQPATASGEVPPDLSTTEGYDDDDGYYDSYPYRRGAVVRRQHYLHRGPRGGR